MTKEKERIPKLVLIQEKEYKDLFTESFCRTR